MSDQHIIEVRQPYDFIRARAEAEISDRGKAARFELIINEAKYQMEFYADLCAELALKHADAKIQGYAQGRLHAATALVATYAECATEKGRRTI